MFNIPVPECWNEYKRTGDIDALIQLVESDTSTRYLPELIHFIAIGTADWDLVERLEKAGVGGLIDDEVPPGTIWSFLQEFGDVPETVRGLVVNKGASVTIRGLNDWTPLHYAANMGYVNSVRELIALGADVDAVTRVDGGCTPLMEAAGRGCTSVVEVLLECGADKSIVNTYGAGRAIDIARRHKHDDIVLLLEGKKPDPWKGKRKQAGS